MKRVFRILPNTITISRIFLSFIFAYLLVDKFRWGKGRFVELILSFLVICISDLLDGKIARKTKCVSAVGAKLDVFADLLYMSTSYMILIALKMLPAWFFCFIVLKFIEFASTSNFINRHNKYSTNPFIFDRVGRLVAASFFAIPGIVCVLHYLVPFMSIMLINTFLYITLVAGVYSSYTRTRSCIIIMNSRVIEYTD